MFSVTLAFNGGRPSNSTLVVSAMFAGVVLLVTSLELKGSDNEWWIITILAIAFVVIYLYLFMRLNPGLGGSIQSLFRKEHGV